MNKSVLNIVLLWVFAVLLSQASYGDHHKRELTGEVAAVSEEYGNVETNIMQKPFEALGIRQGDKFEVAVGNQSAIVHYGKTYSDVEKGEWVGFITDYGNLRIAISYGSAADGLNASLGNVIKVKALPAN